MENRKSAPFAEVSEKQDRSDNVTGQGRENDDNSRYEQREDKQGSHNLKKRAAPRPVRGSEGRLRPRSPEGPRKDNAGNRNGASTSKCVVLTDHGGLISLLDIMLWEYVHFFQSSLEHLTDVKLRANLGNALTEEQCERLKKILEYLSILSGGVQADGVKHLTVELLKEVKAGMEVSALDARIESIQSLARKELKDRKFFYVPKDRTRFYDNKVLCGVMVAHMFPDAAPEIIEAGNCYALARPTACVFHLMRVIPYGMAALAKLLRVKFSQPIECMEWNSIIEPIDKAVRKLQQLPRSSKKFKDQQYYSEIVQHLYFCKDAWRNHVSHSRERYEMRQADSVLEHVSLIMQLLSDRLDKPFTLR